MKKSLLSVLVVGLVALTPAFAFAATFQDNVFKEVSDFADALSRASQGIGATAIQAVNNLTELGKTFDQVRGNSSALVISPILNVTGSSTTSTNGCAPGAYYNSLTGKPCATATTTPTTGPCINLTVTLNRGMTDAKTGNQVSILQKYLMAQGYLSVTAATGLGSYGPATAAAVRRFEQANGLPVNGVVTPQVRAKIKQLTCGNTLLPIVPVQQSTTTTSTSPSIHIYGASGSQVSDTAITANLGTTFTISGTPQNLTGLTYYFGAGLPPAGYYNRAYFFDQSFSNNNSCGNNDSANSTWVMTCTAKVPGTSNFYIEIYANGQTYRSNTVNVTIASSTPLQPKPTTPNKTLAGDMNGDGTVNIFDYNAFVPAYNTKVGSSLYNPTADFNGDGAVDIFDLNMLLPNYGKSVTFTGDVNHDNAITQADVNFITSIFNTKLGQSQYNPDGDVNHDGAVDILDLNTVLGLLNSGTNNATANVSARLSPSSPATRTVTTSATQSTPNVVLGVFGLNAANNSAKITGLNFNVSNSSIYSNLRLVDGSTVYGSNNGYGGFSNLSIALTQNQWKDLTLMADVNAGVNGVVASSTLFANSSNIIGTSGTSSSSPITVSSGAYVANPITFSANGVTASNLMAFTTPQTVNNVTVKYTATFEVTLSNTSNSDIFVSNNPSIALDTSSTGAFGTSTSASINLITTNPYFIAADTNTVLAVPAGTSRIFTFSGPVVSAPGTSLQFKILQINYGTSAATPIGSSITGLTPLSVNVSF